ncbi:phosphoglycolate phosphatase [Chitinibacter bivalviorum]|uniref:Phosphoglycolate phosphatase n=1 Tax=Chitinibacter bivalviorum TaxID=2739434 RepID=A0A7H9BIU8_9NEIS|nr:phosphoglycolate phosphatase [Chitinibacter bivalviorum]QLG87911.1 phosphoglycolate phosphatase [Chitinibacter bivalviorum]
MSIQAIAFDLDGTLVDSLQDLARAANAARSDLGLTPLATATVESYVGDGAAVLVARVLADDAKAQFTGTALQEQGMAQFNLHYRAGLTIATKFYPKVQETLHALHERGLPLAIVTNKPERFTLPLLRELGVFEHFDVIVSGDTLAERKPSPLPMQHVANQLGIEVDNLLMVGDSKNDILAAQNAGCASVLVSYGYGSELESMGADAIIHRFDELFAFLEE